MEKRYGLDIFSLQIRSQSSSGEYDVSGDNIGRGKGKKEMEWKKEDELKEQIKEGM